MSPWEEGGSEASLNVFFLNNNAQSSGMMCVVSVSGLVRTSDDLEELQVCCPLCKTWGMLPTKEGVV